MTAQGGEATFVVLGTIMDGSGVVSNYVGQFNAPIANESPAQLEAIFCPGGVCNPEATFSPSTFGNFQAIVVPEPATLGFVLGSLLIAVGSARRRKV